MLRVEVVGDHTAFPSRATNQNVFGHFVAGVLGSIDRLFKFSNPISPLKLKK